MVFGGLFNVLVQNLNRFQLFTLTKILVPLVNKYPYSIMLSSPCLTVAKQKHLYIQEIFFNFVSSDQRIDDQKLEFMQGWHLAKRDRRTQYITYPTRFSKWLAKQGLGEIAKRRILLWATKVRKLWRAVTAQGYGTQKTTYLVWSNGVFLSHLSWRSILYKVHWSICWDILKTVIQTSQNILGNPQIVLDISVDSVKIIL